MSFDDITLPKSFLVIIGTVTVAMLWTAARTYIEQRMRRFGEKRRVGLRFNDDANGSMNRNPWIDRLIDALDSQASVNTEVAKSLATILAKQDALMEGTRLSQIEHHEIIEHLKHVRKASM